MSFSRYLERSKIILPGSIFAFWNIGNLVQSIIHANKNSHSFKLSTLYQ